MGTPEHGHEVPRVTDDDLLAMWLEQDGEQWAGFAESQPNLAREIEQRAHTVRQLIEAELAAGNVDTLELQKRLIDMNVFSVNALIHAYTKKREVVNTEEPDPPLSV